MSLLKIARDLLLLNIKQPPSDSTGGGSFIIYYTYRSHAYTSERASIRASKVSSSSLASAMDWVFIN